MIFFGRDFPFAYVHYVYIHHGYERFNSVCIPYSILFFTVSYRGSFAVVRKGTNRKDNSNWAIKCIDKLKLDKDDEAALEVEVAILEKVQHPNIVRLRQVFDTPKVFYMVMELMTGGELFDRIVQVSILYILCV